MAGEIVAVGSAVNRFSVGQRVCANFLLDHIAGANTPAANDTAKGALIDGVLTEYRILPEHVCFSPHLSQ